MRMIRRLKNLAALEWPGPPQCAHWLLQLAAPLSPGSLRRPSQRLNLEPPFNLVKRPRSVYRLQTEKPSGDPHLPQWTQPNHVH